MSSQHRRGPRRDGQGRRPGVGGTEGVEIVGGDVATQDADFPGFADDGQVDVGAGAEVVEDTRQDGFLDQFDGLCLWMGVLQRWGE